MMRNAIYYIKKHWMTMIKIFLLVFSALLSAIATFLIGNHYSLINIFMLIFMILSGISIAISFYGKYNFKYSLIFNCIGGIICLTNMILCLIYQTKIIDYSFKNINMVNTISFGMLVVVFLIDTVIKIFKRNSEPNLTTNLIIQQLILGSLMISFIIVMTIFNAFYFSKQIKQEYKAQSIYFEKGEYVLYDIGQSLEIEYSFYPSDAIKEEVEFVVVNEKIATVDENGVVSAKGFGETRVYVKTKTGISDSATILVKNISLSGETVFPYLKENTQGTLVFYINDYQKQGIDESTILERVTYKVFKISDEYQPSTITFSNYRYEEGFLKLDYYVGEISSYRDEENFRLQFYDNKYSKNLEYFYLYTTKND